MTWSAKTREWAVAPFEVAPRGERAKFAVYDPETDSAIRFYYHGGKGLTAQMINLATGERM